jgi:UDP-N-acetyl-D-mannosaminuronic acid dehydrogenase
VVMTKHDEYKSLNPEILRGFLKTKIIIDGRNLLPAEEYLAEGFIFKGIGRGDINRGNGLKQHA